MRLVLACLSLLFLAAIPAAHADTLDVMTVTGNGHTWVFDFPTLETFTYPTNLAQFIPGLTPLFETIDGASVTPTELFFHPGGLNIIGPFGTLMGLNVLDILSTSGPFFDPNNPTQGYFLYTSTFLIGTWSAYGTVLNGAMPQTVDFDVNIQPETVTATPEPPGLILLATALLATTPFLRRSGARL